MQKNNIIEYPYIAQYCGYVIPESRSHMFGTAELLSGQKIGIHYPGFYRENSPFKTKLLARLGDIEQINGKASFINVRVRDYIGSVIASSTFAQPFVQTNIATDVYDGVDMLVYNVGDDNPIYGVDLITTQNSSLGEKIRKNPICSTRSMNGLPEYDNLPLLILYIHHILLKNVAYAVNMLLENMTTIEYLDSIQCHSPSKDEQVRTCVRLQVQYYSRRIENFADSRKGLQLYIPEGFSKNPPPGR